jgi:hypothetical protein
MIRESGIDPDGRPSLLIAGSAREVAEQEVAAVALEVDALEVGDRSRAGSTVRVGVTYLNGRGERSNTDRSDLNVPLVLSCELVGASRWSLAAG